MICQFFFWFKIENFQNLIPFSTTKVSLMMSLFFACSINKETKNRSNYHHHYLIMNSLKDIFKNDDVDDDDPEIMKDDIFRKKKQNGSH